MAAPPSEPTTPEAPRLAALGLGDDWLRAVLWHNGARLLGLDVRTSD